MTSTLHTLLDRVEKGEGADLNLNADIHEAFGLPFEMEYWMESDTAPVPNRSKVPRYTASIDAAVALVEKVLPGWIVGLEPRYYEEGECVRYRAILSTVDCSRYTPHGDHVTRTEDAGNSASPARAIVAAILRAKIAQENGNA